MNRVPDVFNFALRFLLLILLLSGNILAVPDDGDRAAYDNDALFEQMSGAKRSVLERKFGKKPKRPKKPKKKDIEVGDEDAWFEPDEDGKTAGVGALDALSALSLLPNSLVNDPTTDATSQDTQSETTFIVGSNGVVVCSFNDSGSFLTTNHFTGFSQSLNLGDTWTDKGTLPVSIDGDAGDPVLARSTKSGTVFLSTLAFSLGQNLEIFRSTNNGAAFLPAVNGAPGFTSTTGSQDKEWIAVDNFPGTGFGNVYMFWRNFGSPGGMTFTRSTDDGVTWTPSGGLTIASGGQGSWVAVGPDHAVYLFWYNSTTLPYRITMKKSVDRGVSFGPTTEITVATLVGTGSNGDLGLTGFRSSSFPQAAVNPISGNLYVVYPDVTNSDHGDIWFRQSTNGGTNWSAAFKVNNDATTRAQFQPSLAVMPDGSALCVSWYDRRRDSGDTLIERWGCIGTISGGTVTFGPNFRLSPPFSPVFGVDPVINSTYMGDYDMSDADTNFFYNTWGDNRDASTFSGANRKNANVRFARIPRGGPPAVVDFWSATLPGGNGNGLLDPDECNQLFVTLVNDGTTLASNVTATLSTTTAGVTIPQATASYPTLLPNVLSSNTTAFVIETSPIFACGGAQFTLTITSSAGTDSNTFTLASGGGNYVITQSNGVSIVTGITDIGVHADDATLPIFLPFNYTVYGQTFTNAVISSNGNIQFGGNNSDYANVCLPSSTFGRTIFAHWDDLMTTGTTFGVFTSTSGSAPNRIFNIEWRASYFSGGAPLNFEVRLYEGQSKFDIIYATLNGTGSSATIGVQKDTTSFTQFSCNSATLSSGLQLTFAQAACTGGGGPCAGGAPDLLVTKSDAPDPVTVGNSLTYSLTVTNLGNTAAASVTLTDALPASVTFVSVSSGCQTNPAGKVVCNFGTLAGNAGTNITIVAVPHLIGTIINTAVVATVTAESNLANNTGIATTTVNPPSLTLTVTKTGAGSGSVTSAPAGINCGITCAAGFPSNTLVTLSAIASNNAAFTGWSGGCAGTGNCLVTMDSAKAVTATFNAAPIVTGAFVSGGLSDEPLAITGLTTFDGDGDTVSMAYQWQFSPNGTTFADQSGATNATLLAGSGNLWRCRLTPSDAFNTGTNFLTGTVAVNNRPNLLGLHGQSYSYDSDLFLAPGGSSFMRPAIINEFSQGASGAKEWIEILFLKSVNASGWRLFDSNSGTITFQATALWSNVAAGTTLVVYNSGDRDTALPADDTDPADGILILPFTNSVFSGATWIGLNNGGDSIILSNAPAATLIDGISFGAASGQLPDLTAVGAATAARYTNDTEAGIDDATNWQTVASSAATPGSGNSTVNSNLIANLRSGAFGTSQFRFGASGDTVPGLGIDATNGLVTGIINSPTGGFYNVVIERYVGTNVVAQQYTLLVGDSNNVYRIPAGKTWTLNTNYTIAGTLVVTGFVDTAGHTLVVSNTLDVTGGTVSNTSGLIVYHKLLGGPLPGASLQFNSAPVITAAFITPAAPDDTNDLVAAVTSASDADNDAITFGYQWQESSNNVTFADIAYTDATLTNSATTPGKYYQCVITPDDGITNGAPFTTASVQVTVPNPDSDGDGLPDAWELSHFGDLTQDGNGDFDGDGFTNLQEFLAGTNPADSSSALRVIAVSTESNDVRVIWLAGGGTTNVVQSGFFGVFSDISSNYIIPGTGDVITNHVDSFGATNTPFQLYRIRLVP